MTIDETVSISPASLRHALSTIYGESIEIIPDEELLSQGVVAFTGKKTGLAVVKHPRIRVPVDSWRELIEVEKYESVEPGELDALRERIEQLENRIAEMSAIAATTATASSTVSAQPAETEIEPQLDEEEELDADISDEPISLEDLEPEELEPIIEPTQDESEDESEDETEPDRDDAEHDDIMAALAEIDDDEDEIATEPVSMEAVAEDEDDDSSQIGDLDELDMLDDLEGFDLGEESEDDEAISSGDEEEKETDLDEIGELDDELNLDDLSFDEEEIDDKKTAVSEEAEEDEELDLGGDLSEEEFDLDVLSELDLDESDDFTPHKVFDGETILLLGGEDEHIEDYDRIIHELGGTGEWYGSLAHMQSEEIQELVDQSDLVLTVTSESLSDPGILQAANYARDNNKRLFDELPI